MIPRTKEPVSFQSDNLPALKEELDRLHRLSLQRCEIEQIISDALTGISGNVFCPVVVTVPYQTHALVVDASTGNHFRIGPLKGTLFIDAPINPCDGQKIAFEIIQDSNGSRGVILDPVDFSFGTDIQVLNMSALPNVHDLIGVMFNGRTGRFDVIAFVRGYS